MADRQSASEDRSKHVPESLEDEQSSGLLLSGDLDFDGYSVTDLDTIWAATVEAIGQDHDNTDQALLDVTQHYVPSAPDPTVSTATEMGLQLPDPLPILDPFFLTPATYTDPYLETGFAPPMTADQTRPFYGQVTGEEDDITFYDAASVHQGGLDISRRQAQTTKFDEISDPSRYLAPSRSSEGISTRTSSTGLGSAWELVGSGTDEQIVDEQWASVEHASNELSIQHTQVRDQSRAMSEETHPIPPKDREQLILRPARTQQRVRGKMTESQRVKAKAQRRLGNCVRCRTYNLSCDANRPCSQCERTADGARTFTVPCYRDSLTHAVVARHGNNQFRQRDVKFVDYYWVDPSTPAKHLDLKWNLQGSKPLPLPLINISCKQYNPGDDSEHNISWTVNQRTRTLRLPPYAGDDTAQITRAVEQFLTGGQAGVLSYIVDYMSNTLDAQTLREASRFQKLHQSKIIELALLIRCASVCSQGWGSIVGTETLGIDDVDFSEDGISGYAAYDRGFDRPIPTSINHQIDVVILNFIRQKTKELLKVMNRMIFARGTKRWYELYLTTHILLSNLDYVHTGAVSFYRVKMKTKFAPTVYTLTQEMIDEYNYSAENILYHFCSVLRGNDGFKVASENMQELKNRAGLDDEAVKYIRSALDSIPVKPFYPSDTAQSGGDLKGPEGNWMSRLFENITRR